MSRDTHAADIGGTPGGPIDTAEHDLAMWEWRVDAINRLLRSAPAHARLNTHEGRRAIEALGEPRYGELGYYERKIHAIADLMVEKDVFSAEELAAKLVEVKARSAN